VTLEEAGITTQKKSTVVESLWAGVTKYHWFVFLGCWLGGIFDGMDSNLFTIMLPNALQALAHTVDKNIISHHGSVITFLFLIGWTLGGLIFGVIGDKLGRVKSMVFSILLYAIFTGACGFAHSSLELGIYRFLTGLGIGGELVSITTLLSETWPERSRAIAVGALMTSYQFGVFLSAVVTVFIHSWRAVFWVGALPALITILVQTKLNEPQKWEKNAREENKTHFPLKELFQPLNYRSLWVGGVIFGVLLIGYWASTAWIPSWIHDLLGPKHQGNEKSIAVFYHAVAAIVGCLLSGVLANAIGRRYTIAFSFLGCFVASAILFLTNKDFSTLIYWQDAFLGFFIGLNQGIMYLYLPELFQTKIRATGVGFCLNVGRLSSAVAVLFVGTLVAIFHGYAQAAFVFALPYLIGLVAVLFGRETKGQLLPD
jgi:MFS family permease